MFEVDERGFVYNPEVVGAEPVGIFEESALSAITKFKFIPAKRNNNPIKSTVYLPINYEINKGVYLEQRHEMSYTFQ
jgi:protein TonB